MIRLRWTDADLDPLSAVAMAHPRLVRLRASGPWSFTGGPGHVVATMIVAGWSADAWGDWQPGTDGCEFAVATNPPPVDAFDPPREPIDAVRLTLACGERVWVLPARRAARRLGLDGRDRGPATAYGVAAFDLDARMDAGTQTADDIMRVCFLALASCSPRLIPEVCVGLGLLADADICPLLEAAWRCPKAPGGGAISSSSPPVSTPATTSG